MWIWIASYVTDIPCSSRDGMDATGTWQRCRLQPIDAVPDTHSLGCTLPSPQWFEDLVMHHQICTGVPTDETYQIVHKIIYQIIHKILYQVLMSLRGRQGQGQGQGQGQAGAGKGRQRQVGAGRGR